MNNDTKKTEKKAKNTPSTKDGVSNGMKADIYNTQGKKTGSVELPESVFGVQWNDSLMHQVVTSMQANARTVTAHTKNRGEVSGGGKKPWQQKGTGRARVGEIRNPLWRKGGTVFGPMPRSYDYKVSKKIEIGALRAALAQKLNDGLVIVVDALAASEVKTKAAVAMLKRLGVDGKALIVDVTPDEKLMKSVRNMPGIAMVASSRVTARDVANADRIVTTKSAIEKLQEALT